MSEESAFLQAIADNPADDAQRLIYADWLDEQNDPRAEYVRLRLQVREKRGRKKALARLEEMFTEIDHDWRRQVFLRPKLSIEGYQRVDDPITEPVTKFGGQPVWLEEPTWPISKSHKCPMQFVCQIKVPDFFGGEIAGKMVYVFTYHPDFEKLNEGYDITSTLYPEDGDNAVVIQPEGDRPAATSILPVGERGQRVKRAIRIQSLETGPTLYDEEGKTGEWLPNLKPGIDPDYTLCTTPQRDYFQSDADNDAYWDQVYGSKIGGTPPWRFDAQMESLALDPDWEMILHFSGGGPAASAWSGGDFTWSVWATRDGKRGLLMGGRQ